MSAVIQMPQELSEVTYIDGDGHCRIGVLLSSVDNRNLVFIPKSVNDEYEVDCVVIASFNENNGNFYDLPYDSSVGYNWANLSESFSERLHDTFDIEFVD